jgi:hypothetical protein
VIGLERRIEIRIRPWRPGAGIGYQKQPGPISSLNPKNLFQRLSGKSDDRNSIGTIEYTHRRMAMLRLVLVPQQRGTLFDGKLATRQGAQLSKLVRWYSPLEVLAMATSVNGELLALSGLRSPYIGKLGVVEEGALADLLLVDGNPIADIGLIEDPAKNFVVILKDGRVYKNTSNAP